MEEAEKAICSVEIECGAQAPISSKQHHTREPRVSISKCGVHEVCISRVLPQRRDVQQCEVRVFSQRHETRVSIPKCRAHEVCVSKTSPHKREVRVSSQVHETRIFMPKCEVCVSPKRCMTRVLKHEDRVSSTKNEPRVSNSKREPRISETCVSKLRCKTHVTPRPLRSGLNWKVLILRDSRLVSSIYLQRI